MQPMADTGRPVERDETPLLSERHLEILGLAQEGKSAGDIGQIIGLSGRTVEWHLANIYAALGVRTRVQAVVRARELGILQPAQRQPPMGRSFAARRGRRRAGS